MHTVHLNRFKNNIIVQILHFECIIVPKLDHTSIDVGVVVTYLYLLLK